MPIARLYPFATFPNLTETPSTKSLRDIELPEYSCTGIELCNQKDDNLQEMLGAKSGQNTSDLTYRRFFGAKSD